MSNSKYKFKKLNTTITKDINDLNINLTINHTNKLKNKEIKKQKTCRSHILEETKNETQKINEKDIFNIDNIKRKDMHGNLITKDNKKHKIIFRDRIKKDENVNYSNENLLSISYFNKSSIIDKNNIIKDNNEIQIVKEKKENNVSCLSTIKINKGDNSNCSCLCKIF